MNARQHMIDAIRGMVARMAAVQTGHGVERAPATARTDAVYAHGAAQVEQALASGVYLADFWMPPAHRIDEVQALRAWVALPGQVFTLSINGAAFDVLFDHGTDETSRAFVVAPLVDYSDPQGHHYYCSVTLRFLTV